MFGKKGSKAVPATAKPVRGAKQPQVVRGQGWADKDWADYEKSGYDDNHHLTQKDRQKKGGKR